MLRDLPNNIKATLLIVALVIFMAIIYAVFTAVNRSDKIEVTINAVPKDAHITLNGARVSSGVAYLTPGEYSLEAQKDGFANFTRELYIDEHNPIITVLLVPESTEAKEWAKQNQRAYHNAEGQAGTAAAQAGEVFYNANPIANVLPYSNLIFTIGYRADPTDPSGNSIVLTVNAAQGYRNAAVEQVRSLGYDPTNFKFNFRDYENPFE